MILNFRKASLNDWEIISSLEKSVANKFYFPIIKEKEVKDYVNKSEVYVIEKDRKPIGTVSYEEKSKYHAYIDGLTINPKYQGRGYGSEAIHWLTKKLSEYKRVDLVTHPHNSKSIIIYLKNGFLIDGWRDNYFGDGEPRIVLSQVKNNL